MKPLVIQTRNQPLAASMLRKILLTCGILSSLLYFIVNVIAVTQYEGYSAVSQTVSELSAIGAPTRPLWVAWLLAYSLLLIAFGLGVRQSDPGNRRLQIVATSLIANAAIGLFWPPMHQREVLAAGGGTLTDILHIAFTFITVPLMMIAIAFATTSFSNRFRFYSSITIVIMLVTGIFTGLHGPNISKNLPTPWVGVWERICIGVYMIWIIVFAILLWRKKTGQPININQNF